MHNDVNLLLQGGKMSNYLDSLHLGDKVHVKGPCGLFSYQGRGIYRYILQEHKAKKNKFGRWGHRHHPYAANY